MGMSNSPKHGNFDKRERKRGKILERNNMKTDC